MPAVGQGKFVRVYGRAKENLTSMQATLLGFWQAKGGLDA